jgi:hypothetical protein
VAPQGSGNRIPQSRTGKLYREFLIFLFEPAGKDMAIAYDADFIGWLDHQAKLLRTHNHDELDYDNLAEEVEAMSRSQRRELKNRYTVLLMHLLKWQYQPDYRCTSWRSTIFQQRLKLKRLIRDMPSIKNEFNEPEWQIDAWDDAVTEASAETSIFKENFPKTCIWTVDQVLSDWLPN